MRDVSPGPNVCKSAKCKDEGRGAGNIATQKGGTEQKSSLRLESTECVGVQFSSAYLEHANANPHHSSISAAKFAPDTNSKSPPRGILYPVSP